MMIAEDERRRRDKRLCRVDVLRCLLNLLKTPTADLLCGLFQGQQHRMHNMRTTAIDDPDVCQSVCLSRFHVSSLCKYG